MSRRRGIKNRPVKEKDLVSAKVAAARAGLPLRAAPCPHFGVCGGCDQQDLEYPAQLLMKQRLFAGLVAQAGVAHLLPEQVEIIASPDEFGYRGRMDFVVAFWKCGLRKRGDWAGIVDLQECLLPRPIAWRARCRTWELFFEHQLPSYNFLNHRGFMRYIVLRATSTGECLVVLTTKSEEHGEQMQALASSLLSEGLASGVHWLVNEGRGDQSAGRSHRIWGADLIWERYGDCQIPISALSFAQANQAVAAAAYEMMCDWLRLAKPRLAWDLYSGVGAIAAQLASVCEQVLAIENEPENLRLAKEMQRVGGLDRVQIVAADAEAWLLERQQAGESAEVVSINPPRGGVRERGCHALLATGPQRIAYMSCNPVSLLRDLQILAADYQIEEVRLCDMFPQTRHFETLALLRRRSSSARSPC